MRTSPAIAAVAGAPHVTNRGSFLATMQIMEAASIIGLIRRTQSLTGRIGTVAGVFGLFDRDRVIAVDGYDGGMATEEIDLTWKLLRAGWQTANEPRARVGMQVPVTMRALWTQRKRWARGQGEVLHEHLPAVAGWTTRRMWLLAGESLASLLWVICLVASLIITLVGASFSGHSLFGFGLAWGVAIAVIATLQVAVALSLETDYDPRAWWAYLAAPIYPAVYWLIAAAAALRAQVVALSAGPCGERVGWDIPREPVEPPRAI